MSKTGIAERSLNQQICPRLYPYPARPGIIVSIAFLSWQGSFDTAGLETYLFFSATRFYFSAQPILDAEEPNHPNRLAYRIKHMIAENNLGFCKFSVILSRLKALYL